MFAHTIVVIRGALDFESRKDLQDAIRYPVSAFYTVESPDSGHGEAAVESDAREGVAGTLYDLYRMVRGNVPLEVEPDHLHSWALAQLEDVKVRLATLEKAMTASPDYTDWVDQAEDVREAAEKFAFSLTSWDAEQE